MDDQNTIFSSEERVIAQAQSVLNAAGEQPTPLLAEFAALFKSYQRLYKQLRRLITLSDRQQLRLNELNHKLDVANQFIRRTFGRYLSDEIVETLLTTPEGLQLGGEKRQVTIMMTDLRGFTAISERLPAEDVVRLLNTYLESMTDILVKYQGTIDEFIGDAILAIFGAPVWRADDAQRAVACALAMQLAMQTVNAKNQTAGYPDVAMGIGLNTGEVVVGNIGSSKRTKYGVVGQEVNLTSRIESYTVGGQILISEATRQACGEVLRIDQQMEVVPKGVRAPLTIYEVGGIAGNFNIFLPAKPSVELVTLSRPVPVRFTILEGKHAGNDRYDGFIVRLHDHLAEIQATRTCRELTNLKLAIFDGTGNEVSGEVYAKVIEQLRTEPPAFRVNFTSLPLEAKEFFEKAQQAR